MYDIPIHGSMIGMRYITEKQFITRFTKMGSSNSDSPSNSDAMDLINALMNEKGAVADRKSAISFSDFHAAVQKMVEAEIEKHSAYGIGRVDYAVASGGGKLLYNSEGFYPGNKLSLSWREISRRIFSLNNLHPLANEILTPKFGEPGRCLPLKGSDVLVSIKPRIPIFPQAVTLEHVSKGPVSDKREDPDSSSSGPYYKHELGLG